MAMTIKDIARLSGYSVGTVSRVLNNHPDVSKSAKERVMAVVQEQGFEPNTNAKHLKMRMRSAIAILVKGSHNQLFSGILEYTQSKFEASGEEVFVAYLDEDDDEMNYALQLYKQRRPKGYLFLGADLELFKKDFNKLSVPGVLLTNNASELAFPNLSSFSTNDTAAAAEAMDYLYECGHKKIGVIGGKLSTEQISYSRAQGVIASARKNGFRFDINKYYEPCRFSMESGYRATQRLLARQSDITAIFAMGDVIAMGTMRAIADMNKKIPDDISVIGYDGLILSEYCIPRLTTIRQDAEQLADRGVRALLQAIHYDLPPVHEFIPFELVKRESVRRISDE